MSLLDLLKNLTGRTYLPKVAAQHVAAPYQASGADASYSHNSGYICLPISYTETLSLSGGDNTSVAVIRLHKPVTAKVVNYTNQRHGQLPEVYETVPGVYEYDQKNMVVLNSSRSVASPQFGAFETHGASFAASGQTTMMFTNDEHFAEKTERIPQASYDATPCADVPELKDYPRRAL
jgi:hypothetical protein